MLFQYALYVSAGLAAAASVDTHSHILHEREMIPSGLQRGERVLGDAIVPFRVALKQTNLEHGYDYLMNISHPESAHYGQHWRPDQVRDAFHPTEKSFAAVRSWLADAGIQSVTEKKGWLEFETSMRHAEDMLKTKYYEYAGGRTGHTRIGCQEYHLPKLVSDEVDYIQPGVSLSPPMQKKSISRRSYSKIPPHNMRQIEKSVTKVHAKRETTPQSLKNQLSHCGKQMTPDCIRALYHIPDPQTIAQTYQSNPENALGIFEYGSEYNQTDLDSFFKKYAPNVPNGTHPKLDSTAPASIALNLTSPYEAAEANIDFEIAYSLLYPQTVTLYQAVLPGGLLDNNPATGLAPAIDRFLDGIDGSYCAETNSSGIHCGKFTPTRITSISYAVGEIFIPLAQQQRQCHEIMKLSLQGHTVVVASGDWGVAAQPAKIGLPGCIVAGNYSASVGDGTGPTENGTVFSPSFPQNCPYVLSVGGTQLNANATVGDKEVALQQGGFDFTELFHYPNTFASSGGFSNYFCRPSYQDSAVNSYFSRHDPGYPHYTFNGVDGAKNGTNIGANGGLYNRAGRAFPDVSANGRLENYLDGTLTPNEGTSLSAPIWASILTLINEKRSEAGKGPVGFVQPALYSHPEIFDDITKGRNPGCGTKGFEAVEGWDPITGLGTPNYPKLLELFLSLP